MKKDWLKDLPVYWPTWKYIIVWVAVLLVAIAVQLGLLYFGA